MSDKHVLGIDVAKAKLGIALLLPDGNEVIRNTPEGFERLAAWLERNGIYWEAAAAFLAEKGHAVSVVCPAQIKAALSHTKTDKTTRKSSRKQTVLPA
ncbi:MAG: hypothetical protein ACTFAL_07895 [Candidatus Electronema sp. V4]|uniref:hypothetical protein n=1 Tax=Candidatus Electronema sp. V4 TaxID=3454756 RepID=UPI004055551D